MSTIFKTATCVDFRPSEYDRVERQIQESECDLSWVIGSLLPLLRPQFYDGWEYVGRMPRKSLNGLDLQGLEFDCVYVLGVSEFDVWTKPKPSPQGVR